jgi:cellulose synthase/poly-beta-1,6-N-acetylglucosamine synthase-like glycosyltransferase
MSLWPKKDPVTGLRRQWGADDHANPMPQVPRIAGEWSMLFGRTAVVVTVAAWAALVFTMLKSQIFEHRAGNASVIETCLFLAVVSLLAASALAYLVGRLGFYYRASKHRRMPRAVLDDFYSQKQPSLTALVPSYQEERGVIYMTLLSIALQEFPDMNVVLLIDDPPKPRYKGPYKRLQDARALPGEIESLLDHPRRRFEEALEGFDRRTAVTPQAWKNEILTLAGHYEYAETWLKELILAEQPSDHNEQFFGTYVLGQLRADLALTGTALRKAADDAPERLQHAMVAQLYRRLVWTFKASLTSFERKSYVSLSQDANKAMNLNSYIGLMGRELIATDSPAGRTLVDAGTRTPNMVVRDTDYVMTVDADSVILPEYALRLVYLLEQPENTRMAVAQSPYSAFPGARTRIERIAGATTDLQHIIHQGMTYHGASFWVGANAVLRKAALMDIETVDYSGGYPVRRYISDRTVIEDTESTIDLAANGWTLHNYPERLAYSATPPDFGSLCIQRHRWANGGLLIIPKLKRAMRMRRRRGERTGITELLLRLNYMASVFWSSLCVLLLMVFRFDGHLLTPLTYVIAIPYFLAMAVDLRYCGYRATDAIRIYGFNLLLLPVNLLGSLASVVQALTGSKGQFMRTPKVKNRTVPGFTFVVLPYILVAVSAYTFIGAYNHNMWGDAVFAAINAVLAAYAIVVFVGLRTSLVDIYVNVVSWLYKPQRYKATPSRREPAPVMLAEHVDDVNWEMVLYMGFNDRRRRPREPATALTAVASEQEPNG